MAKPSNWLSTDVPLTPCPWCGHGLDTATSSDGSTPSPGSLSVCLGCAQVLVFTETLSLRAMSKEALASLKPEELKAIRLYQAVVRSLDRRRLSGEKDLVG